MQEIEETIKTIELKVPIFLLTRDNITDWFPHSRLNQDSAALLFFIKSQLLIDITPINICWECGVELQGPTIYGSTYHQTFIGPTIKGQKRNRVKCNQPKGWRRPK